MKQAAIRPTSDRVRSSIFNILGQVLTGCTTLDLYAGTGSLGIEALSRGSERAVFIDTSAKALALVKKNLSLCGYEELAVVARMRLPEGLSRVHGLGCDTFDLVFLDPPYGKGYITPTLARLMDEGLLAKDGRVVVEASTRSDDDLPAAIGDLVLNLERAYGSTKIGVYLH
jgi:16S rRNA (guanine966-N2)-methyltransferase